MKKILSIILALTLMMGLIPTAFAVNEGGQEYSVTYLFTKDATRALISNYDSVYEMLPTEKYLQYSNRQYLKHEIHTNMSIPGYSVTYCNSYAESRVLLERYLPFFDSNLMNDAEDFHNSRYVNNVNILSLVNTKYICATGNSDDRPTTTQIAMKQTNYWNSSTGLTHVDFNFVKSVEENVGDSLVPYWSATAGVPVTDGRVTIYNGGHMKPIHSTSIINDIKNFILS